MIHATFAGQGLSLEGHALPTARPEATITPDQEAYGRSIVDTCRTFAGTPFEPDILRRLRTVASKHSVEITNEPLIDILAEALHVKPVSAERESIAGGAATGGAQPESVPSGSRSEALTSLEQESFQENLRKSAPANSPSSPVAISSPPLMPQTWRMSRLDSEMTYADGRKQLRAWIDDINARRRLEGKSEGDFSRLLNTRYLPEEMNYDPDTGIITLVGHMQPLWHHFWRRVTAAYKAFVAR